MESKSNIDDIAIDKIDATPKYLDGWPIATNITWLFMVFSKFVFDFLA